MNMCTSKSVLNSKSHSLHNKKNTVAYLVIDVSNYFLLDFIKNCDLILNEFELGFVANVRQN